MISCCLRLKVSSNAIILLTTEAFQHAAADFIISDQLLQRLMGRKSHTVSGLGGTWSGIAALHISVTCTVGRIQDGDLVVLTDWVRLWAEASGGAGGSGGGGWCLTTCMGYLWGGGGKQRLKNRGRGLFSCHFTTESFPSVRERRARGKVGSSLGWLTDGVREVN